MKFDGELINIRKDFLNSPSFSYKEADTGKYIFVSDACASRYGVSNSADLIGQKMEEMCKFLQPKFSVAHQRDCEIHDLYVRENKEPFMRECAILAANGDVSYRQMIKNPTLGPKRNLLTIFTYSHDLTPVLPYADLYKLHRQFYAQLEAIQRTLAYLDVEESFVELPSEAQLRVFFAKAERYPHKQIARYLNLSPRTVDCHVNALRNKVINGDLNRVLARIKCRQPRLSNDDMAAGA